MTAASKREPIDWQAYLEGEERATRKHEYVCGYVYAMAGARKQHNRIAKNVLVALERRIQGSPCEAFGSDMKVRIRDERGSRFYYPDVTVECGAEDDSDTVFTDIPAVIVEVSSRSTRRIDEGEKREVYLKVPSLNAYILVDSERPGVVVWRRSGAEFKREVYADVVGSVALGEINASLPLVEVYANVVWPAETDDEAED